MMKITEWWTSPAELAGEHKATVSYRNNGGWESSKEGVKGIAARWKNKVLHVAAKEVWIEEKLYIQRVSFL